MNDAPWRARPLQRMSKGGVGWKAVPQGTRSPAGSENVPYLYDTALFLLKESCGEGYLVQRKVASMDRSEYRFCTTLGQHPPFIDLGLNLESGPMLYTWDISLPSRNDIERSIHGRKALA
jgi:hypothetical protein